MQTPVDWRLIVESDRCVFISRDEHPGTRMEIFLKGYDTEADLDLFVAQVRADREQIGEGRGGKATLDLRLFADRSEYLTNGTLVRRRWYPAKPDPPKETYAESLNVASIVESFFRSKNGAVVVVAKDEYWPMDILGYKDCEIKKWKGKECTRMKLSMADSVQGFLAAALTTVPES